MVTADHKYLDLTLMRPARLKETPPGGLFIPATENGDRFVAGRVNVFPALVILEGDKPFRASSPEEWSRGPGIVVDQIKFQADPSSARRIQHISEAAHGSLLLSTLGTSIVAYDHNGMKAVLLADGEIPTDIDGKDAISFLSWRIVSDDAAPVVLFET